MSGRVVEVTIFGERRTARVTKNRANWKVEWRGSPIDSFVPTRMAVTGMGAAAAAARVLEDCQWGSPVLAACLRGLVETDGAMSTELARWISAKAEGRPFDRNERVNAGHIVLVARQHLFGAHQ